MLIVYRSDKQMYGDKKVFVLYDNIFFSGKSEDFDCMIYYVFLYNGQDDQLIG